MKTKMPERIYVSNKTEVIYPLKEDGDNAEIDLDNPVNVNVKMYYKKIGHNNMFTVYELKKQYLNR